MWMGKIALIMYAFSIALLFCAGWINAEIFNNPTLNANGDITYNALNTLFGQFNFTPSFNAAFIFGDFITGIHLIAAVLTGAGVSQMLNIFPFVDTWIHMLVTGLYATFSFFFILYLGMNRSV